MEEFRGEKHHHEGKNNSNMLFCVVIAVSISLTVFCLLKKYRKHSKKMRQNQVRERAFNQNMNQSVNQIIAPVTMDQQIQYH
jgi:ABC-type Zn2+ transport system substrate-binding protein/surface adhesin